jgi:ATPase family AAA domain-containing protein 1
MQSLLGFVIASLIFSPHALVSSSPQPLFPWRSKRDTATYPQPNSFHVDKLRHEREIEHTKLIRSLTEVVAGVLTAVIYYHLVNKVIGGLSDSISGLFKQQAEGKPSSSLPPNILKFLAPNTTISIHELEILQTVTDPQSCEYSFEGLGGLHEVKRALSDCVLDLLADHPSLSTNAISSTVLQSVHGILLFGPPGCGKTALVNALSREMNLPIIRVTPSLLLRKYVGETSAMTKAVFSAANKLQPCILFVDEMDALFRTRTDADHHVDRSLSTECKSV